MLILRNATEKDWDQIWPIVHEVIIRGDTYPYPTDMTKEEAFKTWMIAPKATYLAVDDSNIVGTYYIKANQPGAGSHVCNAGYMVSSDARGKGIGRAMCAHSLKEAVRLSFRAMQYNLVVTTNQNAIALWKNMGFNIIGTLPKAFFHKGKGFVDAHVMYQWLEEN